MGELFTVGHSQHTLEYFMDLLKKQGVNYVLDVRSTPYSKYAEQFNRENVCNLLQRANITYSFMGKYFGARPEDKLLYNDDGYLDFEKVTQSEKFNVGIKSVLLGLEQGNNIALMCTEKDPLDCHRAIMVARAFNLEGIKVKHILSNGNIQTQRVLDKRLLEKYFPDRGQLSLFSYDNEISDDEYIRQAYRKRNREIGYHLQRNESVAI
jgi:uncharacterized protein (DUF488 family)